MYLSNIKLWNFRKYGFDGNFDIKKPNLNLDFNKTLNVLIGENDSGKTAIVDAIKLVLKTRSFEWIKLNDDDFFNGSQRGRIELTISDLSDDEAKNFIEWLSYDKENKVPYLRLIYDFSKRGKKILSNDVCAGPDENGTPLNAEAREFLKAVYLKPLRDAQTELTPGKYSRLASILNSNDTINEEEDHLSKALDEFNAKITSFFTDEKGKDIANKINDVIKKFCDDQKQIEFKIAQSKNLKDILTKLELSIQEMTNPGLGTLNRLYMAAELLNLQDSSYEGLKLGLIEELEAHLHPQAQMKVIEHLQKLSENTQFILTTHSPNLASKVKIENLILCDESNCFPMGEKHTCLDKSDYIFLQKFLDVTKSNLFFAKGILFVEGWAEEIFLPSFANFLKSKGILKKNLTEAGVSIINVGSTAFLRFSKIFQRRDEPTISTPVGIITDSDVKFYQKTEDGLPKKIDCTTLVGQVRTAKENKEQEFNAGGNIRVFLALNWTFEFALHQSKIFSSLFHQCTTSIHTQIDQKHFEEVLAQKLLTQKLKKTDIAYSIAQAIDEGQINNYSKEEIETDKSISYLVKALKFTCNQ